MNSFVKRKFQLVTPDSLWFNFPQSWQRAKDTFRWVRDCRSPRRMTLEQERRREIRAEANRVHEASTYASETQLEYAKRWRTVDRWIGSLAAALAAVSGVGGLAKLLSISWAGSIAVASALVGAIAASIGARQVTEKSGLAGNAYRALQQDTRIFLNVDLDTLSVDDARSGLQGLVDRLQQLNREAVIPSGQAWRRAKQQIESGSQAYEADN